MSNDSAPQHEPEGEGKDAAADKGAPGKNASETSGEDTSGEDKSGEDKSGEDKSGEDKSGEDKPEEPPLYKRPMFWIVGGGVALVLVVGGTLWWLHARQFESTDDAFVDAHIVRIAAQTSGRLTQVPDLDNRHVHKGDLLAVIEPETPDAGLNEAKANVQQSGASVAQAQAKVLSAIAARHQAQADALAPLANAAKAQADYQRYLDLARRDPLAVAATQIDAARAQAEASAAQALSARRHIASTQADILAAQKDVDAARAQEKASKARADQAKVTVGYTQVRAPIDGQVVNRAVNVGSYVAPGQQMLAIVPDQMWITANFKETQLTLMHPGQAARVVFDAYPGVEFPGHVDSVQRGAGQAFAVLPPQNATGNYVKVVQRVPVRILLDRAPPPQYVLGPGMSAVPRVTVR